MSRVFGGSTPERYRGVVPPITKHGPTVFEHDVTARAGYFDRARSSTVWLKAALGDIASPLERFQQVLRQDYRLSSRVASDQSFGPYSAGILRSIEEGTPVHIDFAPHESPGWEMISFVEAQLAANVYLEVPPGRGELVIYDKLWGEEDERHKYKDRFGYDDAVVAASESAVIEPKDCAIALFNSRFFHRVRAARQRRLTFSFFLAFQNDYLILWS